MHARELRHRIAEFEAILAQGRQRMPRGVTLQEEFEAGEGVLLLRGTDQVGHIGADPQAPVAAIQRFLCCGSVLLHDLGRNNRLSRPVDLIEGDDPEGLTGQQRADVDETIEVFPQFCDVPSTQIRDLQPSFQAFTEKSGEARAMVPAITMNPAQMVLQAEPARGLDRTDHAHSSQSDRRSGPGGYNPHNMAAAWKPGQISRTADRRQPPNVNSRWFATRA